MEQRERERERESRMRMRSPPSEAESHESLKRRKEEIKNNAHDREVSSVFELITFIAIIFFAVKMFIITKRLFISVHV